MHVDAVHLKKKPFNCKKCPKSFSQKGNLKTHVQFVHKRVKSFKCSHCSEGFAQKINLKTHIKNHHKSCKVSCKKLEMKDTGVNIFHYLIIFGRELFLKRSMR